MKKAFAPLTGWFEQLSMAWKLAAIMCLLAVPLAGFAIAHAVDVKQKLRNADETVAALEAAAAAWPIALAAATDAPADQVALERLSAELADWDSSASLLAATIYREALVLSGEPRNAVQTREALRRMVGAFNEHLDHAAAPQDAAGRNLADLAVRRSMQLLTTAVHLRDESLTADAKAAILAISASAAAEQFRRTNGARLGANQIESALKHVQMTADRAAQSLRGTAPPAVLERDVRAFRLAAEDFWGAAHAAALQRASAHRDTLRNQAVGVFAALAALLAAGFGGALWIAHSILAPHRELVGAMRRLVDGDTRLLVPHRRRSDEVGDWARAVEVFRVALIERQMLELDLAAERDALEARVRERTRALAEARAAAEAANAAKSSFLAIMSHEIRTPLNGVLGMAAALTRTDLQPKQQDMLQVITDSGAALLTLLNDVLDLSKIEAGRIELERAPFRLAACVDAVLALYREAAEAKSLTLSLHLDPDVPDRLIGDATRLRQILQNLISNAVKFTERGGVTLRVRTDGDAVRPTLTFEVIDSGVGMTEAQRTRLFQPFVQADASTTRRYGGTGLGLAICRQLAELMGGEIFVESAPGQGSTFRLPIPFEVAEDAEPEQRPREAPAQGVAGVVVLAADDNAANRRVISTVLEQAGVSVTLAADGQEAVEIAALRTFDLVLLDLHMPVVDGFEAARAIRALGGPNAVTPIIALSADLTPSRRREALEAGMDGFVGKPFRPAELLEAIAALARGEAETEPMRRVG